MSAHADLIDWILNLPPKPIGAVDLRGVRGESVLFRFGDYVYGPIDQRSIPFAFHAILKDLHPIRLHYVQEEMRLL